jgi:hypothetical protein
MPLNLPSGGGDFTPVLKYDASAGIWKCRDDSVDGAPMQPPPTFLMDIPNLQTGWIYWSGNGPQLRADPQAGQATPSPTDVDDAGKPLFARGFRVEVYNAAPPMNGAREWMSTAGCTHAAMNKLFGDWEQEKNQHPNQLPIVANGDVVPVTVKHGTIYSPDLSIIGWDSRPAEWGAAIQQLPSQSGQVVPPPIQAVVSPPPPPDSQAQAPVENPLPEPAPNSAATPGSGIY